MGWPGYDKYIPPGVIRPDGRVQRTGKAKYGNRKTTVDGRTFDSAKEARRWMELKMLQEAGEITALVCQPVFRLEVATIGAVPKRAFVGIFTPDFAYQVNGQYVVEDVKSPITRRETSYRLRKRMFEAQYMMKLTEV